MIAVVLAGGHATRLWPVTENRAKPLLPLGERPIIDYIVDELQADRTIISTNEKFEDDFKAYASGRDVEVFVEDQGSEQEKPGTIGALINLIESEGIDEDLLVIGGDNYYSFNINEFKEYAEERGLTNAVFDVEEEKASQLGIVDVEDNRMVDFVEKPDSPPSTLASTACYFFPAEELGLFNRYEEEMRGGDLPEEVYLDSPGQLIQWAVNQTDVYAYPFNGEWHDIGTPQGYLDAQASVTSGSLEKGAVENSEVLESLVLGDAEVQDSELENCVVFPGAEVVSSKVRNSIIDSGSRVEDAELNDAVIGKNSRL